MKPRRVRIPRIYRKPTPAEIEQTRSMLVDYLQRKEGDRTSRGSKERRADELMDVIGDVPTEAGPRGRA